MQRQNSLVERINIHSTRLFFVNIQFYTAAKYDFHIFEETDKTEEYNLEEMYKIEKYNLEEMVKSAI